MRNQQQHAYDSFSELSGLLSDCLKGTVHIFPLTWCAIYPSRLFVWYELPCFGDVGHRDVNLFSNIMEPDGTQLVLLKVPTNTFEKLDSNVSFPEIMTRLVNPQTLL